MGYYYSSPLLEAKLGLYDTCGVGNLHGIPSIIGAFASVIFISANPDAVFLEHEVANQIGRQFAAILCTLVVSVIPALAQGN